MNSPKADIINFTTRIYIEAIRLTDQGIDNMLTNINGDYVNDILKYVSDDNVVDVAGIRNEFVLASTWIQLGLCFFHPIKKFDFTINYDIDSIDLVNPYIKRPISISKNNETFYRVSGVQIKSDDADSKPEPMVTLYTKYIQNSLPSISDNTIENVDLYAMRDKISSGMDIVYDGLEDHGYMLVANNSGFQDTNVFFKTLRSKTESISNKISANYTDTFAGGLYITENPKEAKVQCYKDGELHKEYITDANAFVLEAMREFRKTGAFGEMFVIGSGGKLLSQLLISKLLDKPYLIKNENTETWIVRNETDETELNIKLLCDSGNIILMNDERLTPIWRMLDKHISKQGGLSISDIPDVLSGVYFI